MTPRLESAFYGRDANIVARELIGKIIVYRHKGRLASGRIAETEAYLGSSDEASHAYRGRSLRNAVMFGPPGHCYVYFTYGMHYCMNVVTGRDGEGQAVLLRALEPMAGREVMQQRRHTTNIIQLANGPAKLVQALGLDMSHNGTSLLGDQLWIEDDGYRTEITVTPRVGISKAVAAPLRFYDAHSLFVSKPNKNRYNA